MQVDHKDWQPALEALGFYQTMKEKNLSDLGIAFDSEDKKNQILSTLASLFAQNTREHWIQILRNADIISTHVNTMLDASNEPNIVDNNYVSEKYYPEIDKTLKIHGTPWKFSETPSVIKTAPKLGEHNEEILKDAGYSKEEIKNFKDQKVI
jgi:crotonobetainyl-CoA:carnitine CoA-transferase CaiB-like acyl-CoA transferase